MDGEKGCMNVRGLTLQEAKECVKDRRATYMIQSETVKAVDVLTCFVLGLVSSEG